MPGWPNTPPALTGSFSELSDRRRRRLLAPLCGIDEAQIRAPARSAYRQGNAGGVSIYEDLGIEMAPHSTLVSYLQRLIWILVGSFNVPGGTTTHSGLAPMYSYGATGNEPKAPVTGGRIISGLVPCNEIPDMIMTDHPDRMRGMFIESANPVHSLAESPRWREAMRALDFSVVIDIAMTETAREASYVLPASSQYEKSEATFFGACVPREPLHRASSRSSSRSRAPCPRPRSMPASLASSA